MTPTKNSVVGGDCSDHLGAMIVWGGRTHEHCFGTYIARPYGSQLCGCIPRVLGTL